MAVDMSRQAKEKIINVIHRANKYLDSGATEDWRERNIRTSLHLLAQKGITTDKQANSYLWEHRYEQEGDHTQVTLENLGMELIGTKF